MAVVATATVVMIVVVCTTGVVECESQVYSVPYTAQVHAHCDTQDL
jgi:hypothetical protein